MMGPQLFSKQTCRICDRTFEGSFRARYFYCELHRRDEVEHHQCLPEEPSKDLNQMTRLYAKRWNKTKV